MTTTKKPNVNLHNFHRSLGALYHELVGRDYRPIEDRTARALMQATMNLWAPLPHMADIPTFQIVATPTGSGKTTAAKALMLYGSRSDPEFSGAIIVETIEEAHRVYRSLKPFMSAQDLAVYSRVHRTEPSSGDIIKYLKRGVDVADDEHFSHEDLRKARVVICTHNLWREEVMKSPEYRKVTVWEKGGGVAIDRSLIIIDEDPHLGITYSATPEDVGALASLLSEEGVEYVGNTGASGDPLGDFEVNSEDARWPAHPSVPLLRDIQTKMEEVIDTNENVGLFHAFENFKLTADHAHEVFSIDVKDIRQRVRKLRGRGNLEEIMANQLFTLKFLKATVRGWMFYSRLNQKEFLAYEPAIEPTPNTMILDGTALHNGMFKLLEDSNNVIDGAKASYKMVKPYFVVSPHEFEGRLIPGTEGIYDNQTMARTYLGWFKGFLVGKTQPGEEVLVYCKVDLIEKLEAPYSLEDFPSFGGPEVSGGKVNWEGRTVHFCNFGRGRGTNNYRGCTKYFQLVEHFKPKNKLIQEIGSARGQEFTQEELNTLSSGRTKEKQYRLLQDGYRKVQAKQDATRICIRELDGDGRAPEAELYFIDVERTVIQPSLKSLFPEIQDPTYLDHQGNETTADKLQRAKRLRNKKPGAAKEFRAGGAQRLADVLMDIKDQTGAIRIKDACMWAKVIGNNQARTINSEVVRRVLEERDMVRVLTSVAFGKGRGWAWIFPSHKAHPRYRGLSPETHHIVNRSLTY